MLVEAHNALGRGLTSPQRDRGRLTATTAPVSLPSFSFFELPQHGLREDTEVRPVRSAAVCRPLRTTFHRHAEVRHHRSKGQSLGAAPRRWQHSLLVDCGLLHCLCHLHRPAGLGTPKVYGFHEEEVPHWEEEVVSFRCLCPDAIGLGSQKCKCSFVLSCQQQATCNALLTWDLASWFESEQACSLFGLHLACEHHELASPATAFVFLPVLLFCLYLPLSLHQEACGPCLCDPVHTTLLCLSHRKFWGTSCCGFFSSCFICVLTLMYLQLDPLKVFHL